MNLINNFFHNRYVSYVLRPLYLNIYRFFIVPFVYPRCQQKLSKFKIKGEVKTAKELVNSHNSFGRYGNGELRWMLGNEMNNFERNSPLLKKRLIQIIKVNNPKYMVGLPDAFISLNQFDNRAKKIWGKFVVKYSSTIIPYLNIKTKYYDANTVRPYMDYHDRKYAKRLFNILKNLWSNKNLLIVEGRGTRLGIGNDLFSNANSIKRIECPLTNAFESYNKIYGSVKNFLEDHKKCLVLLSLGPTATVLSYDIFKLGYRAVDIGHIDAEYSWYLMHAQKPVNIPNKYTNEARKSIPVTQINNNKYYHEIVDNIY